jgi:CRISPR-associated endonuclease Cas2
MRTSYIVTYDIADDKRLRKVFQTMRKYGDHLQFSVFECPKDPRKARASRPAERVARNSRRERGHLGFSYTIPCFSAHCVP